MGQSIEREDHPTFNLTNTFYFDGKQHIPKPITCCTRVMLCCACPAEVQYYSSPNEYIGYGQECCCCFAKSYVERNGTKIGYYETPGCLDNGLMHCLGLKCSGPVTTSYLKIGGQRTYETRRQLTCCANCCVLCSICFKCCSCSKPWVVEEQPIYQSAPKCSGHQAGVLRTIFYKGDVQNVIADVKNIPIEHRTNHKATLSLLAFMAASTSAPFQQGSQKQLMVTKTEASFENMLVLAGLS